MAYHILKGSSATPLVFLMVESADHITGLTGATVTVTLSKNGAAFGSPSGAVTEIANGWYQVAGNATDTNTGGPLVLHATATSGDPTDMVVADIIDPTVAGYGVNLVNIAGSAVSTTTAQLGVNAVQINAVATTSVTTINANQGTTQPVNFSGTGSTAYVKSDTEQLNAQTVTAAAGVTFPASVASPTNITAGTITTVTNLTNAPTSGDFTATMKTSITTAATAATPTAAAVTAGVTVTTNNDKTGYSLTQAFPSNFSALGITVGGKITEVALVDTLTTYTSNTPQTGDGFARLGAPAGASVSADVAAVKSDTGTTLTDAATIKTKTDQFAFTKTSQVDANILSLNSTTLNGNGSGTPWGP